MFEERNKFISEMNLSIISQKKKFQCLLRELGWNYQSVVGLKEEQEHAKMVATSHLKGDIDNDDSKKSEEYKSDILEKHRDQMADSFKSCDKNRTLCLGTSRDSEKQYNDLLALLSFQPKVKQEKLTDTQVLAGLLENERNAKRRRISYRNKVHTKNKSHTEVLREVIREQMAVLEEDDEHTSCLKTEEEKRTIDDGEMIQVSVMDGNPHLAWQTVGTVVAERRKDKDKKDRTNSRRNNTFDDHEPPVSMNHQPNLHRSRHSPHHPIRSSTNRKPAGPYSSDLSPSRQHHSTQSHISDRSHSRHYRSKNSHSTNRSPSRKYSSKHSHTSDKSPSRKNRSKHSPSSPSPSRKRTSKHAPSSDVSPSRKHSSQHWHSSDKSPSQHRHLKCSPSPEKSPFRFHRSKNDKKSSHKHKKTK